MPPEVMADDGEGRGVGEGGSGPEHDAVRQIQWDYLRKQGLNLQMEIIILFITQKCWTCRACIGYEAYELATWTTMLVQGYPIRVTPLGTAKADTISGVSLYSMIFNIGRH